jgi:SAM-dependent methyltransferase
MPQTDLQAKWDKIYLNLEDCEPSPALVLAENAHLLPHAGHALDLACGLGGNALFLARRGFAVSAWDISTVAIAKLTAQALTLGLVVDAQARDVETGGLPWAAFDVVVVSHFLCRPLAGPIMDSLTPGGLLFYQTYTRAKISPHGPRNSDFLLADNELLRLFDGMRVLFYREDGRVGDWQSGRRDEAFFIGQKR